MEKCLEETHERLSKGVLREIFGGQSKVNSKLNS